MSMQGLTVFSAGEDAGSGYSSCRMVSQRCELARWNRAEGPSHALTRLRAAQVVIVRFVNQFRRTRSGTTIRLVHTARSRHIVATESSPRTTPHSRTRT